MIRRSPRGRRVLLVTPVFQHLSQAPWNRAVRIRTREWRAWLRADPAPALARPRAALDLAAATERRADAAVRDTVAVNHRLLLVRHGESTWNAEHRLQGQADPPLSELGREQAEALLPFLDGIPDRRLSSDLTRAVQTAELLGLAGAPTDPRWREIDIGDVGRLHARRARPRAGGGLAARRATSRRETFAELQARVGGGGRTSSAGRTCSW